MNKAAIREHLLFIDGQWCPAADRSSYSKTNPYTGEVVARIAAAKSGDARRAVDAAAAAFPVWSATPPAARRALFLKAADLLEKKQAEISLITATETGETFGWGMFNCLFTAGLFREAAAQAYSLVGEVIPSDLPDTLALATRQPVGVVVGIAPWNAPLILGARALAMPIAYGNTVVLKASEESPGTHAALVSLLVEAGIPRGVINLITNAPQDAAEVVEELIAHPKTRHINFTGSTKVGRIIAEKAGRHLKRTLLELGGKAPMIVLEDADLEAAAAAGNFGAFMNQGQICMSTERIVAERPVAEALGEKLATRARSLQLGDPCRQGTQIGCVINQGAIDRVQALVDDAVAKGAKILCGGQAEGASYVPTVLYGVTPAMRIYHEESFGPVVSIVIADNCEEALRIANDTEYGLASAIFSRDINKAMKLAERIEAGICHINGATVHDEPQMPFGGVKDSGWGRFGGKTALEEFTELRWITVRRTPTPYPM
jgi:acyl-CoA reductase-like NAD-dependent aldehyde dehydrogenase